MPEDERPDPYEDLGNPHRLSRDEYLESLKNQRLIPSHEQEMKFASAEAITRETFHVTLDEFIDNFDDYIERFAQVTRDLITKKETDFQVYTAIVAIVHILQDSPLGVELSQKPAFTEYLQNKKAYKDMLDREGYQKTLKQVERFKKFR